jgi:hypothetical protein
VLGKLQNAILSLPAPGGEGAYSNCEEHVINTFSIFKETVVREFTQLQFYSSMISSTFLSEPKLFKKYKSKRSLSDNSFFDSLDKISFLPALAYYFSVRKKGYFDISFFLFDQLLSEVSVQGLPSDRTGYYKAHVSALGPSQYISNIRSMHSRH